MSSIVARAEIAKEHPFIPEWEYLEDYVWVKSIASKHKVANMMLNGTLHFISTPNQQNAKDLTYKVKEKEAQLLARGLVRLEIGMSKEDTALLADFSRRNRSLNRTASKHLDAVIRKTATALIERGMKKANVNGFFWDIQMRRLKCRWLVK